MKITDVTFTNYRCFTKDQIRVDSSSKISVVVGKNNSGKSRYLELVKFSCGGIASLPRDINAEIGCVLEEKDLQNYFLLNCSGGDLIGNHWGHNGALLVGRKAKVTISNASVTDVNADNLKFNVQSNSCDLSETHVLARKRKLQSAVAGIQMPFFKHEYVHISADRDIRPEFARADDFGIKPNGDNATLEIERLYNQVGSNHYLIAQKLLQDLNLIFSNDANFEKVHVMRSLNLQANSTSQQWELWLKEKNKEFVSLSTSGSGLKTVILVILNMLLGEAKSEQKHVYAFEELENNLHPSLLRRLLTYVCEKIRNSDNFLFITTHSSVVIDFFRAQQNDTKIVRISKEDSGSTASVISEHFEFLRVVSDLGARPSDLLNANGIVWVEGPSDRLYVNRWIDLLSNNSLVEGRDYQCAYFGGILGSTVTFNGPEKTIDKKFANLLCINPNFVFLCDSDKKSKDREFKSWVQRIKLEIEKVPTGSFLPLEVREIENYLPGEVLSKIFEVKSLPNPAQFESFFAKKRNKVLSYLETHLAKKNISKTELAIKAVSKLSKENLSVMQGWEETTKALVKAIQQWAA